MRGRMGRAMSWEWGVQRGSGRGINFKNHDVTEGVDPGLDPAATDPGRPENLDHAFRRQAGEGFVVVHLHT